MRDGTPVAWRTDLPPHEYMAEVCAGTRRIAPGCTIWPMGIREPLQVIPVPVRPEDTDAALDLQRMVDLAYERAGYEPRVDYAKDPTPPLACDTGEWARAIVSSAGSS